MVHAAALLVCPRSAPALAWWLAHHVAVGFSTLLVAADRKNRSCLDLLDNAAQLFDLRHTDVEESGIESQQAVHSLLKSDGQKPDWVLQLAEDEYFLPAAETVSDFLRTALSLPEITIEPAAGLSPLSVNWCIAGLNGHAPASLACRAPRAMYTRHAPITFPDHRVTRSFFSPDAPSLPDPFSQARHAPDWSQARILHDAAVASHGAARAYYDRNEESDSGSERFLPQTRLVAASLVQTALYRLWQTLRKTSPNSSASPLPQTEASLGGDFYLTDTAPAQNADPKALRLLVIDSVSGRMAWKPKETWQEGDTPLCFQPAPADDQRGWLFPRTPIALPYLPRHDASRQSLGELLALTAVRLQREGKQVIFRHALGGERVALPENRSAYLAPNPPPEPDLSGRSLRTALSDLTRYGLSADGLTQALRTTCCAPMPSVLGGVLAQLPETDRAVLLDTSPFLQQIFPSSAPEKPLS
ncbi:glycosyltransferase family 2 protein [Oecophyllibacter saccharovorans]|uniref:Uncharacterized protein n=1 Tax=Oecophyllibacter saccharovorans TaxID=2558360 RepID=A0A506UR79_9PROT|nr:glycosyltransferase family 2 protein [Oecophyllibacter saccharovorans]TPW35858.1 hypothetical protein E3202_02730 [Oecophyllibacter saccharovorans]